MCACLLKMTKEALSVKNQTQLGVVIKIKRTCYEVHEDKMSLQLISYKNVKSLFTSDS